MFEIIVQFVLEVVGQVLVELLAELGWESLRDGMRPRRKAHPALAALGQFLLGLLAGGLSLLIVGHRLFGPAPLPGVSLILSPLATGAAMHVIGGFWPGHFGERPGLFEFRAGAICAFGMALVRFLYFEDPFDWWPR